MVFDTIGQNISNFSAGQELKKRLDDKQKEKSKIYNYIGMDVYDLYKKGDAIQTDALNIYLDKLEELDKEIKELEMEQERLNTTVKPMRCSCGNIIAEDMKFCSKCGKPVVTEELVCKCGKIIKKNMRFCSGCGRNVNELINVSGNGAEDMTKKEADAEVKKCICGAQIAVGQSICMECGRKVSE